MKPLFDKTEFKKQMSKMFEMETESEKKAYQIKLQVQAEKEMRIIKAELLQGGRPPMCEAQYPKKSRPQAELLQGAKPICVEQNTPLNSSESNILKDFYDYIAKKANT